MRSEGMAEGLNSPSVSSTGVEPELRKEVATLREQVLTPLKTVASRDNVDLYA